MIQTVAKASIKIDGKDLAYPLNSLTLDERVNDHCVLKIQCSIPLPGAGDKEVFVESGNIFDMLGKQVKISFSSDQVTFEVGKAHEFIGIITNVDLDNDIDKLNQFTITACDPTFVMSATTCSNYYRETKASDIISQLLNKHSIPINKISLTNDRQFKFYYHSNESDYDFIRRLAAVGGSLIWYDGSKVSVCPPSPSSPVNLDWQGSLGSLSVKLNCVPLKFQGSSFNYNEKDPFEFETRGDPSTSLSGIASRAQKCSKEMFPLSAHVGLTEVFPSFSDLSNQLTSLQNAQMNRLLVAVGETNIPTVTVGRCVNISKLSEVNGKYMVTRVEHHLSGNSVYNNKFYSSPIETVCGDRPAISKALPELSVVTGIVTDNNDPEMGGRVKVKFNTATLGEDTDWARCAAPHAGGDHSFYIIPEIGDEVVVAFEDNDPSQPIVLGSIFNSSAPPDSEHVNSENEKKLLTTKSGNMISICDTSGGEEIAIATAGTKSQIVMKAGSSPSITVKSDGDITLEGKNITIKASGKIDMSADKSIEQNATGKMVLGSKQGSEMKAPKVEVKADTTLDLSGSATVTVKGGVIKLN